MRIGNYKSEEIRKLLEFILTSTDAGHLLKNPKSEKCEIAFHKLIISMEKSFQKLGTHGDTPTEVIKNSIHYKFAEICKNADDEEMWRELIKSDIPAYGKAPKHLLVLGGFAWHCNKFPIAPYPHAVIRRAERQHRHSPAEIMSTLQKETPIQLLNEAFTERMDRADSALKNYALQLADLKKKVDAILHIFTEPVFIRDNQIYTIRPVKTLLFEEEKKDEAPF